MHNKVDRPVVQPGSSISIAPPQPHHYVVGQDGTGRWIALETHGLGGGMFVSREAALHHAAHETDHCAGAVEISTKPLSLSFRM